MSSTEWYTPRELVEKLQDAVDGFDLDPASGCEPGAIARNVYTKDDDGLEQPWYGKVFVNPPYGRWENPHWMEKIAEEAQEARTELVVAIVPANTDTDWWHDHVATADWISLIDNRFRFGGADGSGKFANAIAVWGDEIPGELLEVMQNPTDGTEGNLYSTERMLAPGNFFVGELYEVTLGTESMGFPDDVDETALIEIITGKIKDDVVEIMGVQARDPEDGPEVYYLLSAPLSDLTDIRCSISHMRQGWTTVPLVDFEPMATWDPIEITAPRSVVDGSVSLDDENVKATVATDGGKEIPVVESTVKTTPAPLAVDYYGK